MCCFSSCFSLKDIGSGYRRKKTTIYSLNRLTTITRSDGTVISYGYDKRNQLVRENDPRTGKTIVYTYDIGGNLTSQKEYAYTTAGTLSAAPTKTITASYSTAWKDQLLSWDGEAMRIGDDTYFYVRNAQNDIIALVDTAGSTVVKYEYDSWGKSITISGNKASTIGVQNPLQLLKKILLLY